MLPAGCYLAVRACTAGSLVAAFELPAVPGPTRPRLLSHGGRWGRARSWLEPGTLRILDIG